MAEPSRSDRQPIVLAADEGRHYALGRMRAVFKADGAETGARYSISEWWLEPGTAGPGKHSHDANDDIFYVIEGTAHIWIGDRWIEAPRGSFVCVPAGIEHDFENRSDVRVGLLNIYVPGGFENDMPAIVQWFKENG
jgi:mannose-6-phosphate isomerase-like protein (cupin superfamily)